MFYIRVLLQKIGFIGAGSHGVPVVIVHIYLFLREFSTLLIWRDVNMQYLYKYYILWRICLIDMEEIIIA
jgi:hypothetical protein